MDNPFAKFKPVPASPTQNTNDENPFSKFQPTPSINNRNWMQGGDINDELNKMREQGEFDAPLPMPEQGVVQSQSEIYSPVNSQDKYKPLEDYENSFAYKNGLNLRFRDALTNESATYSIGTGLNPFGEHFGEFRMPPELEKLRMEREKERETQFGNTGQADTMLGGIIPVRTQARRENNPAFDPSKPESPENPAMVSTRYLVDPPNMDTIQRMGYQVLQNIVGGVGDFVTEGKLTGEGAIGRSMPETVPNEAGEKFVTDMTTFIVGPMALGKAAQTGAGVALGAAGKAAQTLSPEAIQAIKSTYETTLKATGSAAKARLAANGITRNMLVGLSFGVNTGKMGLADAIVAPNDSQGLVNPEWIQRNFGVSRERADDYSVMFDSPVIAGTLGTFGKMYNVIKDKVVSPTIGGLRNVNIYGLEPGKVLKMSDKNAGLKLLTTIDPNITTLAPEDAAFKIKALADSIQRNGVKNFQLSGAGKEIKLDSPSAFADAAQDYYRTAYANLKDSMGTKEFNEWVADRAHESSRTLFEIRTAIASNDPNAIAATKIKDLFDEGSNAAAGGNLQQAQGKLGQMAEQRQLDRTAGADMMEDTARKEMEDAKAASERGISDDPEFKLFMEEANAELGSKSQVYDLVHGKMSEKTYQSLKKLKTDTDNAYKAISDTGAEGDPVSFLETVKNTGMAEDPFFKKVAEQVNSDPSIGNIYNNVRKEVNDQIRASLNSGDSGRLTSLYALRDNINNEQLDFVAQQGDEGIKKLVDNAKDAYNKYRTTFGEPEAAGLKKAGETRLKGEKFDPGEGPGQGKTNWDITFGNHIQQLDGVNGKPLREALQRAAKTGGQNIDGDLANYYATRAITNLTNSVSAGSKQSVGQLRANISGIIEGLQGVNSPMVGKLRQLETKLQTLENISLNKTEAYETIKRQADDLRKEASTSILGRFIYKGDGQALNPSEVGAELKSIFKNKNSVSNVQRILKEAQKAGMEKEARETLQGTYLDYLGDRVQSRSSLGIGSAGPNGEVRSGFRISETQADKIFDEGGNDLANMKEIFSDKPEIIKTLDEVRDVYTNLSKKTPKMDGDVLGPINRSEDPEQALQSVVTLVFGPLNRTGSKVRRITTPMGVESLAQVRAKRAQLLNAMMEDPDQFSEISKKIADGIMDDQTTKYLNKYFGRGFSRANSNLISEKAYGSARGNDTGMFGTGDFKPALKTEMEKLNIQK